MKTFLGVHYPPTGRRNGFGVMRDAGIAGVATFDGGFPARYGEFYATRFTVNGDDNPPDFYTDPHGSARRWIVSQAARWRLNPGAHCRIINNELDIETPAHAVKQNLFYMSAMQAVEEMYPGEKIGICSYAGGNPSDNALVDGTPCSLEERWRPMLPAIKYAGEHGHYVVLHIHQQNRGNMESSSGQSVSLRHRRSIAYWLNNAAHPECVIIHPPKIIFNEVSNGVGGVEPNENQYIASVTWLDQQLRDDVYNSLYTVLCLYQAGGNEPISERAYNRLADYINGLGEITIHPLPVGDPPPPPVQYVRFGGKCPQAERAGLTTYCESHGIKLLFEVIE